MKNIKLQVTSNLLLFCLILSALKMAWAQTGQALVLVKPVVSDQWQVFQPGELELKGYLAQWYQLNLEKRLLAVDENNLLTAFYSRSDTLSKLLPPNIRPNFLLLPADDGSYNYFGEHLGKYLHAASLVWRQTGNRELKAKMDRLVQGLIKAQGADGYLGTYPINERWTNWDAWVHKYNLIGLLSYYEATGDKSALNASRKIADLMIKTFGDEPGKIKIHTNGNHVGMASGSVLEPMVQLYSLTAEKKYLDFCTYIVNGFEQEGSAYIFTGLLAKKGVDKVANGKAYEMLSLLTGMACYYRYQPDKRIMPALENAWTDIVNNRLYLSGTMSSIESFRPDHVLPANNKSRMGEGCATVTWMQFNWHLLRLTGNPRYAALLEKTIYNALPAAINPQTGCVSYFTPLVGKKPHNCDITCCMSSVPRAIALLPQMMAGHYKNGIMIGICNSFALKATISGQPYQIDFSTNSPINGGGILDIKPGKKTLDVWFRLPEWAKQTALNGKSILGILPEDRLVKLVTDTKTNQAKLDFTIQDTLLSGKMNSYNGCYAWRHGPQLLAIDAAMHPDLMEKYHSLQMAPILIDRSAPKAVSNSKTLLPKNWFGNQLYQLMGTLNKQPATFNLVPYSESGQLGEEALVWLPVGFE